MRTDEFDPLAYIEDPIDFAQRLVVKTYLKPGKRGEEIRRDEYDIVYDTGQRPRYGTRRLAKAKPGTKPGAAS